MAADDDSLEILTLSEIQCESYATNKVEPFPCSLFCADQIEGELYVWGGIDDVTPTTTVHKYDSQNEIWNLLQTKGSPPQGYVAAACTSIGHHLYVYGGHDEKAYYGSLHQFDVHTCTWRLLSAHSTSGPKEKFGCGMVSDGKDKLVLFGGYHDPRSKVSAQLERFYDGRRTNELHTFDLKTGNWFSPEVTGTRPPLCSSFSLTKTDDCHAVLFGGRVPESMGYRFINSVYIIDLERMYWRKLYCHKEKPCPRSCHAATCLGYGGEHPQLLVTGGWDWDNILSDVWMLDLQSGRWKEILLPGKYRVPRDGHHTVAFSYGPKLTEVVIFGGYTAFGILTAETTSLLFEYTGENWMLKDCYDSASLGNPERLRRKRELKKQCDYLAAYQRILTVKSSLGMLFIKMVLVGPPGLGKTTMCRRLTGEIVDISSANESQQTSTGAVESSQIVIRNISSTTVAVGPGNWSTIDLSEEACMLLTFFLEADKLSTPSAVAEPEDVPTPSLLSQDMTEMASPITSESPESDADKIGQEIPKATTPADSRAVSEEGAFNLSYVKEIHKMFAAAMISGEWEKIGYSLQSTVVIKVEDTGGQPELMDMLPVLILGPSLYLLFCNLLDQLKSCYTVSYRHPSGESTPPVQSSYTVEEILLQALSAVACFRSTPDAAINDVAESDSLPKDLKESSNSVAFVVGTHKDLVTEEQITAFDKELQRILTTTSFYTDGLVEFASEKRLLLAVDNQNGGAEEVESIRKFLEDRIQHNFKKISIPVAWLILSLFLRKSGVKLVSLKKCEEIARELGMSPEENRVALWFLHHHAGVLMYFPNLAELQNTVICDVQVIYDSVSYMIIHTFKFGKVKKAAQDLFKETGQFKYKDIVKALEGLGEGGDYIPLKALLELLQYVNITAIIKTYSSSLSTITSAESSDVTYFMPCLLQQATKEELKRYDDESVSLSPHDNPCAVMIHFECGFVPIGVFPAMIANLINHSSMNLILENIKKNRVQFQFGVDYDLVTFISRPKYYEIRITRELDEPSTPVHEVCNAVREICEVTLRSVTSCMNYTFCMKYQFSFECPLHPREDHLCAVGSSCASNMLCLKNLKYPKPVKMESRHLMWYGKSTKLSCGNFSDGDCKAASPLASSWKFTLRNIISALKDLSPRKHLALALELNLSKRSVEKHEMNWPRDSERVLMEILQDWLDDDESASWDTLRKALKLVQPSLADTI